jgi:hypothetical protein
MNSGRTVFAQLLDHLPSYEFQKCVTRYRGDYQQKTFSCWDQYLSMAFAQLTYRDSLRDIEACLRSMQGKLYHMGFRGKVARSTLADANESRDWRIYADFAQVLIGIARPLHAHDPMGVDLEHSLYALDSTTIDLCLSLFPWARFRQHKAAVKMHTLLDLHGNIPTFIRVTDGKVHDVNGYWRRTECKEYRCRLTTGTGSRLKSAFRILSDRSSYCSICDRRLAFSTTGVDTVAYLISFRGQATATPWAWISPKRCSCGAVRSSLT